MKFVITRTSLTWDEKPCDEVVQHGSGDTAWWSIEVPSLEHLMEFLKTWEYGIVIHPPSEFPAMPEWSGLARIEIYDDYRE